MTKTHVSSRLMEADVRFGKLEAETFLSYSRTHNALRVNVENPIFIEMIDYAVSELSAHTDDDVTVGMRAVTAVTEGLRNDIKRDVAEVAAQVAQYAGGVPEAVKLVGRSYADVMPKGVAEAIGAAVRDILSGDLISELISSAARDAQQGRRKAA